MAQFHDSPALYLEAVRGALGHYDRLQQEVVAAGSDVAVSRLLDLGVGTGETLSRCRAAHPSASIVGLDASPDMLALAAGALGTGVELIVGRLQDALPEGPFELIVSALAVHHLDPTEKADLFRRVAEALAPDGRFVLGDVVVPGAPVARPAPIEPGVDLPDRTEDLLGWLAAAGLKPRVHWCEGDLAVIAATRGTSRN